LSESNDENEFYRMIVRLPSRRKQAAQRLFP